MTTKHYVIIGVAALAVWYFLFRKKDTAQNSTVNSNTSLPRIPMQTADKDQIAAGVETIVQRTPMAYQRPSRSNMVTAGVNINSGGSRRVFGNKRDALTYYRNNGGGGSCNFVELYGGGYEVNCP